MQAILNFFGIGEVKQETKRVHTYRSVITEKGKYTKRDDGVEYFIDSDLLS